MSFEPIDNAPILNAALPIRLARSMTAPSPVARLPFRMHPDHWWNLDTLFALVGIRFRLDGAHQPPIRRRPTRAMPQR